MMSNYTARRGFINNNIILTLRLNIKPASNNLLCINILQLYWRVRLI